MNLPEAVSIPTADLRYKWQSNICSGEFQATEVMRSKTYESALRHEESRRGLKKSNPRLVALYEDILARGMVNPLIVKPGEEDEYYVIVGNQRLSVIRALRWSEAECLIAEDQDSWGDQTRLFWTYKKVEWNETMQRYEHFEGESS